MSQLTGAFDYKLSSNTKKAKRRQRARHRQQTAEHYFRGIFGLLSIPQNFNLLYDTTITIKYLRVMITLTVHTCTFQTICRDSLSSNSTGGWYKCMGFLKPSIHTTLTGFGLPTVHFQILEFQSPVCGCPYANERKQNVHRPPISW